MKNTILFILLFFTIQAWARSSPVFYLLQILPDKPTNQKSLGIFTNSLSFELAKKNIHLLDGVNPGPEDEQPDYFFNGKISFQGDRYQIDFQAENITNQMDRWEDHIYTMDVYGSGGLRQAGASLADRIFRWKNGLSISYYRERTDYLKIYGRERSIFNHDFHRKIGNITIFNIFNIPMQYPYGVDFGFSLKFGIDFFDFTYIWMISNTFFGGGGGAKVFSYRGPEAMSFLPVHVYVPIFIFPDDYEYNRKDLYLTAEFGLFIPQYSFIDVGLKLLFNGISISLGWLYLPAFSDGTNARAEYWTIYGGLTFSFGQYHVDWK